MISNEEKIKQCLTCPSFESHDENGLRHIPDNCVNWLCNDGKCPLDDNQLPLDNYDKTEDNEERFCTNCKWSKHVMFSGYNCRNPKVLTKDLVTGEVQQVSCKIVRGTKVENNCGPSGKAFEPR